MTLSMPRGERHCGLGRQVPVVLELISVLFVSHRQRE